MRILLAFSIVLSASLNVLCQDCAQTLRLARATYEQGRLHEIEGQLKTCLESGFTKDQNQLKVEAYRILCLSYIYLEEPEKADDTMLKLKLTDPYYEPNPAVDPAEFVALYNTFRKDPVYRVGITLGGNFSQPNVKELVTVTELSGDSEFKRSFAIQFGGAIDVPLNIFKTRGKWTLHGELLYQQRRYEIDQKETTTNPIDGSERVNEFEGIESQSALVLPVALQYKFLDKDRLNPFIGFGIAPELMFGRKMTAEKIRGNQPSVPEKGEDLAHQTFNLSAIVSTGVKIPMRPGFIVVELRYAHGLTNITTEDDAYANQALALDYTFADSIFKMSSLSISASYIFDKFSPKKLKRKS
ncbi:porin family protein [Oscillatoria amoena NRMC-F 0135]|nr:porin family protein [Oscillatoria amoena NRMC-F 0135]